MEYPPVSPICMQLPTNYLQNNAKAYRDLRAQVTPFERRDPEIKGFVLFVGKRAKTWYFQKDVGGQTKRILIGRYAMPSIDALGPSLELACTEIGKRESMSTDCSSEA